MSAVRARARRLGHDPIHTNSQSRAPKPVARNVAPPPSLEPCAAKTRCMLRRLSSLLSFLMTTSCAVEPSLPGSEACGEIEGSGEHAFRRRVVTTLKDPIDTLDNTVTMVVICARWVLAQEPTGVKVRLRRL